MLITLLAILILSLVVQAWGWWAVQLFSFRSAKPNFPPGFVFLFGLIFLSLVGGLISFFLPLGNPWVKGLLFFPLFLLLPTPHRYAFLLTLIQPFRTWRGLGWVLFVPLLLLILVLSSSPIIHPDTLGYHAPVIHWIESYRIVPGLAHWQPRLGIQNAWFTSIAWTDFPSYSGKGLLFLPATTMTWLAVFFTDRIYQNLRDHRLAVFIGWVLLLGISLFPVTLLRLTASSTHPDFMAVVVVWAVIYLWVHQEENKDSPAYLFWIVLLSAFAVTIKLSVLPIGLLALISWIKSWRSQRQTALFSGGLALLLLSAFLIRNAVSSGYLLFPSVIPDWVSVDWKLPREETARIAHYVTGYARGYQEGGFEESLKGAEASLREWFPVWRKSLSVADRSMMAYLLIALIITLIRIPAFFKNKRWGWVALISWIGIGFWFIQAPDPRFGYAFITGAIMAPFCVLLTPRSASTRTFLTPAIWVLGAGLIILTYAARRFSLDKVDQFLLYPAGLPAWKGNAVDCKGHTLYVPLPGEAPGWGPLPCTPDGCSDVEWRGETITDGFRKAP